MDVISTTKYAHVSAKKARDVVREIQGLPVSDALDTLTFTPRKSAHLIGKTLKAAIANAENNFDLIADDLIVKSATVTEGPSQKRFKPRARGSAGAIIKRTSHINIILSDEYEAPEERSRIARKDKKRHTAKSLFGQGKAKPAKEDPTSKTEESSEEIDPSTLDLGRVYDEAPEKSDDLTEISGVGPVLVEKLNSYGIYTFSQIAEWSEANIDAFDKLLDFKGRIEREDWLKQASELAAR